MFPRGPPLFCVWGALALSRVLRSRWPSTGSGRAPYSGRKVPAPPVWCRPRHPLFRTLGPSRRFPELPAIVPCAHLGANSSAPGLRLIEGPSIVVPAIRCCRDEGAAIFRERFAAGPQCGYRRARSRGELRGRIRRDISNRGGGGRCGPAFHLVSMHGFFCLVHVPSGWLAWGHSPLRHRDSRARLHPGRSWG